MLANGMVGDTKRTGGSSVSQGYLGQTGIAVLKMYNAAGAETDNYDTISGVQYWSDDPSIASIVDEDANPKDATIGTHAVGTTKVYSKFDGDPGDGEREFTYEATVEVLPVPDGGVTEATFAVTFQPVDPA
jgi:hypothetical protein